MQTAVLPSTKDGRFQADCASRAAGRFWPAAAFTAHRHLQLSTPDVLKIGIRRKASSLAFRERNLTVNDNVELPSASGLDGYRPTSTRLKPSLHTEGFGFVVSDNAVKDQNRHIERLPLEHYIERLLVNNPELRSSH
jgi:hypothetical protein